MQASFIEAEFGRLTEPDEDDVEGLNSKEDLIAFIAIEEFKRIHDLKPKTMLSKSMILKLYSLAHQLGRHQKREQELIEDRRKLEAVRV